MNLINLCESMLLCLGDSKETQLHGESGKVGRSGMNLLVNYSNGHAQVNVPGMGSLLKMKPTGILGNWSKVAHMRNVVHKG